jgi:hypothetical protein
LAARVSGWRHAAGVGAPQRSSIALEGHVSPGLSGGFAAALASDASDLQPTVVPWGSRSKNLLIRSPVKNEMELNCKFVLHYIYSFFANLASRKRRSAKLRLTRLAFVL